MARGRDLHEAALAAAELGYPLRLKRARGGYDGRGQWRIAVRPISRLMAGARRPRGADGEVLLLERELDFAMELSVCARVTLEGPAPPSRSLPTRTTPGSSSSRSPRRRSSRLAAQARALAVRIAERLDIVGTVTAELFLLRDGTLAVNELAPRVHNSGHVTQDACVTSQFEQHVRAMCGLPLGDPALRESPRRDGQPARHRRTARGAARGPRSRARGPGGDGSTSTTSARCSSAARWAT
jgi:5-(carboxyamino)imidazole ribonucleotide synthase